MTTNMPTRMMISVALLVSWMTLTQGFVVPSTHIGSSMHIRPAPQASKSSSSSLSLVILSAKTTTSRLSKRRRRKQQSPSSDETKEPEEEDLTPPEPVEPVAETTTEAIDNRVMDDDDILAEDEEWEYYDVDDDEEDNEPENDGPVRGDQAISFAVTDVRALVGGRVPTPPAPAPTSTPQQEAPPAVATTPSTPQSTTSSTLPRRVSSTTTTTGRDDSLERLLADAQQLQQLEKGNAADDNEDGFSIPSIVRSVISTIVTIDFFVVCGFLAWFLAGIFASSVLDNDAIQIAFNGVFESLVQPALGILMLAALADAVSKQDDEQD